MSATVKAEDFANYFGQVNGQTALKPVREHGAAGPATEPAEKREQPVLCR